MQKKIALSMRPHRTPR